MRFTICLRSETLNRQVEKRIRHISEDFDEWMEITACKDADSLYFRMEDDANKEDLLILDTEIFEEDGVEVARKLRKGGYDNELIFLTEDKSKVFESFSAEPLNYILKDEIGQKKFKQAFSRACERIHDKREEMIALACAGETRNLNLKDIFSFQSDGRIIEVHFGQGEAFRFYSTIGKVSETLFGKGFVRIHRGIVVSLAKIERYSRKEVYLVNGECFPISKTYYRENQELFSVSGIKML